MDGEKDVLVGCASDDVGGKEHGEGKGMMRLEIERERQLEAEDGKDKRECDGCRTHELPDLFLTGKGLATDCLVAGCGDGLPLGELSV